MSATTALPSRRSIKIRSWVILAVVAFLVAASCLLLLFGRVLDARSTQLQEMTRAQARF